MHRFPEQGVLACIVRVYAGHDLGKRGLAGTILADQRVHLALEKVKAAVVQSMYTGKGLVDVLHLKNHILSICPHVLLHLSYSQQCPLCPSRGVRKH